MNNPRDGNDINDLDDFADDSHDQPTFQRLRKQTGKAIKGGDRQQERKAFGRAVNKYHKERRKYDGNNKP